MVLNYILKTYFYVFFFFWNMNWYENLKISIYEIQTLLFIEKSLKMIKNINKNIQESLKFFWNDTNWIQLNLVSHCKFMFQIYGSATKNSFDKN